MCTNVAMPLLSSATTTHAISLLFHYYFLGVGDVWFSLRNTTYQNNIGEGNHALLCITNLTACCRSTDDIPSGAKRNWYFPNRSRVPGSTVDWNFFRDRGQRVVQLNRRRGGEEGIYRCEIPDSMNVTQTMYIGVYTGETGEWHCLCVPILFDYCHTAVLILQKSTTLSMSVYVEMLCCNLRWSITLSFLLHICIAFELGCVSKNPRQARSRVGAHSRKLGPYTGKWAK